MFKKLLVFILSFIALFSFSGCLVVPQDGTDNGTNIEEMFSGLMSLCITPCSCKIERDSSTGRNKFKAVSAETLYPRSFK